MRQWRTVATTLAMVVAAAAAPQMQSQTIVLKAQLSGAEEVPGLNTGAHGSATVTVDRAAGTITYEVNVYNLPTGIVASHIHVGAATTAGPVIFNFTVPAVGQSNDFKLSGSLTPGDLVQRPATGINSFEDAIFAIASGNAYVNVHSQANTGGEIRGQLCPSSSAANTFNAIALCRATN